MKAMFNKGISVFICITAALCFTGCYNGNDNSNQVLDTTDISKTASSDEEINTTELIITTPCETTAYFETTAEETTYNSTQDSTSISEDKPRVELVDFILGREETLYLELPTYSKDIDKIKDYYSLSITLFEKTDLSFIADFPHLRELDITTGEENAVPDAWKESYVESYDFLNSLNNLEYLRISKEPTFNTKCLQNMDNLKYLHFYGTNVELEGYFPNIQELSFAGWELSSGELYDFFPNLIGLETHCIDIDLKSVGKMDKLEILKLGYYQSYSEINEIVNNKNLRSLTLHSLKGKDGSIEPVENEEFLLELPNLEYFWCYEGVISDETINKLLNTKPQCDAYNHGLG